MFSSAAAAPGGAVGTVGSVSYGALMVTGHRQVEHRELVLERCRAVLEKLAPASAISGGAEGADAIFARAALDVGVPLRLYLPNRHYCSHYPRAVPDDIVAAAADVVHVVDRPDVADWRQRWSSERWWVDNFARNAAMVRDSDAAVVVSPRRPAQLHSEPKGGTAACVRDLARARPHDKVIWVPDDPHLEVRWARPAPAAREP